MYDLPKKLEVSGKDYEIRSDFRVILDIFEAFGDNSLSDVEKWLVAVQILFVDYDLIDNIEEAMKKASWFINCGKQPNEKNIPKRFDWKQDFQYIVAPINKTIGKDIRGEEYCHWWTFMGYFNEIGECTLATIVSIRDKIRKGKKLEKYEQEFYDENPEIINFEMDKANLELLELLRQ
jgi:hypothetical protein